MKLGVQIVVEDPEKLEAIRRRFESFSFHLILKIILNCV
jgi:hypothetical protein